MHLLQTTSATLDDIVEPRDLDQPPGDIVVLSFADSDLAGLAAAYAVEKDRLPTVRLAHLRDLRHPMSIDLWIDKVARHAKIIVVRLLGGLDWWRYGVEALAAMAEARKIDLAVLPGEDRDDPRLVAASTLPQDELATLLEFFRQGGRENLRALLRRLAIRAGYALPEGELEALPHVGGYLPGIGVVAFDRLQDALAPGWPVVPFVFYRSALLAGSELFTEVEPLGAGAVQVGASDAWASLPPAGQRSYASALLDRWSAATGRSEHVKVQIVDDGGRVILEESRP